MNLKISVEFYNKVEAELFKQYPNYENIINTLSNNIYISKSEFLAYMMFTEQANETGFKTYEELQNKIKDRLGDIDVFIDFNRNTIKAKISSSRMQNNGFTERIGVSLGLSVVNKFHNLNEADWAITDDKYVNGVRQKDFDYEIHLASDGEKFIQVENKGSITNDNRLKSSSISSHYSSIKNKKETILKEEFKSNIPRHQNIYYGTIAVLDNNNEAKLWLVDPPTFFSEKDVKLFKLITRLTFYSQLFKDIGVIKKIILALDERINSLNNSLNYEEFNNKQLPIGKTNRIYVRNKHFVKINENEAFGQFFLIDSERGSKIYLLAVTKQIIKLIINQNFEEILNYDYKNAELSDKVIIELNTLNQEADFYFKNSGFKFSYNERKNQTIAQKYSTLNYTNSGRIFGLIE